MEIKHCVLKQFVIQKGCIDGSKIKTMKKWMKMAIYHKTQEWGKCLLQKELTLFFGKALVHTSDSTSSCLIDD